jgi:hypothetical protein
VVDSPRRALDITCGAVFVTDGAGGPEPALGSNVQAQQNYGSAFLFFNVVIVIYGHAVMSANVRAETTLGERRRNRLRRNMFLRSSLRFSKLLTKLFPKPFSKLLQRVWKNWLGKKVWKKMVWSLTYTSILFLIIFGIDFGF